MTDEERDLRKAIVALMAERAKHTGNGATWRRLNSVIADLQRKLDRIRKTVTR